VVSASPPARRVRTPSWLDLRLVAGALLVLVSLLGGIELYASADHSERVWAVTRDLSAGVVLRSGDLKVVAVRIDSATSTYIPAATTLTGQTLGRELGAGELVPRAAVGPTAAATTVTIPLSDDDAPPIQAGNRITVWVSTKTCPSTVVLADVTVQDVRTANSGAFAASGGEDIVVRLSADDAARVVQALALDNAVLRAGILTGSGGHASSSLPALTDCASAGS
jgi:hypothetical protein